MVGVIDRYMGTLEKKSRGLLALGVCGVNKEEKLGEKYNESNYYVNFWAARAFARENVTTFPN